MQAEFTALMYHDVIEEGRADGSGLRVLRADSYKVTTPRFRAHLSAIHETVLAGRATVGVLGDCGAGKPAVLLTFDDGGICSCHPTADLLEEFGWRGHFFIPTGFIGTPGFLDAAGVRELRRRGHVVGSHSHSHPAIISACSWETLMEEWSRSVKTLSDIIGERVTTASIPGGYYSGAVARAASMCGVRSLFTSEPTTRNKAFGDCRLYGRFVILGRTSASECGRLAAGCAWPRWKQRFLWDTKKTLKRLSFRTYSRLRRLPVLR